MELNWKYDLVKGNFSLIIHDSGTGNSVTIGMDWEAFASFLANTTEAGKHAGQMTNTYMACRNKGLTEQEAVYAVMQEQAIIGPSVKLWERSNN